MTFMDAFVCSRSTELGSPLIVGPMLLFRFLIYIPAFVGSLILLIRSLTNKISALLGKDSEANTAIIMNVKQLPTDRAMTISFHYVWMSILIMTLLRELTVLQNVVVWLLLEFGVIEGFWFIFFSTMLKFKTSNINNI